MEACIRLGTLDMITWRGTSAEQETIGCSTFPSSSSSVSCGGSSRNLGGQSLCEMTARARVQLLRDAAVMGSAVTARPGGGRRRRRAVEAAAEEGATSTSSSEVDREGEQHWSGEERDGGASAGGVEGKKKESLKAGSPIVVTEAPPLLKTAEPMPMMRANTGLIKAGDAGRVIDRRPKNVWAVRFAVGAYLIDRKYFEPLEL